MQMIVVEASLVVGTSVVGYVVVGHGFGLSRPSWGPPFQVWIDPTVPQRLHLHQLKRSCDCGTDCEPSKRSFCDDLGSLICVGGLLSLSIQMEF